MKASDIAKRIYPSVVTFRGDWERMIRDVKRLKICEFSLFLTGANSTVRKRIYQRLEKLEIKRIVHVHLRHDMTEAEIKYLASRYGVKVFTIHYSHNEKYQPSQFCRQMFVENNWLKYLEIKQPNIKKFGGICLDLSHLLVIMDNRPGNLETTKEAIKNYKIGCNHVSEVRKNLVSHHQATSFHDFDYLAKLPKKYFSNYVCLEITNSIPEQLKFKKYIAKILAKNWK
ncbi:MAG: hypothetical protein WC508_04085 [Patescibacteria group bacterium]